MIQIDKLDGIHKLGLFTVPITILLTIIIFLLIWLIPEPNNWVWGKSFLLGAFTGLMNFGFFVKGSKKLERDAIEENGFGLKRNVIYFFFRILVFVAIFALVITEQLMNPENPSFHIIPTAIGYFMHLIVLLVVYIVFYIKGEKVSIK